MDFDLQLRKTGKRLQGALVNLDVNLGVAQVLLDVGKQLARQLSVLLQVRLRFDEVAACFQELNFKVPPVRDLLEQVLEGRVDARDSRVKLEQLKNKRHKLLL